MKQVLKCYMHIKPESLGGDKEKKTGKNVAGIWKGLKLYIIIC
jgi:hypothetical protein